MFIINSIKKTLFQVDTRILGIFRILFGSVLFFDLINRLSVIHLFYTNKSILPTSYVLSTPYKVLPFTLLPAFNQSWEVYLFLTLGLISCIFFILGYKTKLMQVIASIVVLSFHNKVTTLENGGDMVVNNFIIWALFLPLGLSYSIDSLILSLKEKIENNSFEINNYRKSHVKLHSFAYFSCLIQISMIYFFNFKTKSGDTWVELTSLHYFFELDSFLTPTGYWAKDFFSHSFKSILTRLTLLIEMSVPFLIFIPIFTKYIRTICFVVLLGFHLSIGTLMSIGTFSWIMIAVDSLLLCSMNISIVKYILIRLHRTPITLIYDSDCGLCHYIVRIIKRLDAFKKITIYGNEWKNSIDPKYELIRTQSILVFDNTNPKKIHSRHFAFFNLIGRLPFGFLISWLILLPGISHLINFIYKKIADNRAKISLKLGLSECGISQENIGILPEKKIKYEFFKLSKKVVLSIIVFTLLIANIQRSLVVNDPYKSDFKLKETNIGRKVLNYLRMKQNWKMFAPSVLKNDVILVTNVTTIKNEKIDPLTGEKPLDIDDIDFQKDDINYGQFVRKFMKRSVKNNGVALLNQYEKWLKMPIIDINGVQYSRAKSFKVWKLSQYSSKPGKNPNNVRKKLILEYPDIEFKGKKIPVNKRKTTRSKDNNKKNRNRALKPLNLKK